MSTALTEGAKDNFRLLLRCAEDETLRLLSCDDQATGAPRLVICGAYYDNDEYVLVPLAKMFDGNPYDELVPPCL